jgi:hypothetical protein
MMNLAGEDTSVAKPNQSDESYIKPIFSQQVTTEAQRTHSNTEALRELLVYSKTYKLPKLNFKRFANSFP